MKFQRDNLFSRTDTVAATDLALAVVLKGTASSALPVTITPTPTTTSTVTRVAANTASVQLLAANTGRLGATVMNNAVTNLFVKLGTTAVLTAGSESFTVKLIPGAYYEVPFGYTGRVDGIWDTADAAGEALLDELTA